MKNLLKRLYYYLIGVVKRDITSLRFDISLKSERRLIRNALKRAYSLHMTNNKRYYILRMSKVAGDSIHSYFTSGKISNGKSVCIIISTRQADILVLRGALNSIMWKRRFENQSIFYVDGYFDKQMKASFRKIDRFRASKV